MPMFMYTTQIHRAQLPVQEVGARLHNFDTTVTFQVPVHVDIPAADATLHQLEDRINLAVLQKYNVGNNWKVVLSDKKHESAHDYVVALQSTTGEPFYSVSPLSKEITLHSAENSLSDGVASLLEKALLEGVFKEELTAISQVLHDQPKANSDLVMLYSSTYNVVFNLFVENGKPVDWAIERAIAKIEPVLQLLNHFDTFKISTLIQYYTKLRTEPVYDQERNINVIQKNDLSTFLNYGEWDLNNNDISPSINFLLYFSEGNYKGVPLHIEGSTTNSFLVPQWGGVQIYNRNVTAGERVHISESELDHIVAVFVSQLFELLGVPKTPKSTPMRIDALHRIRTLENLKTALANLGSLIKLTETLSEISIPESTNAHVLESLAFYDRAVTYIGQGDFVNAIEDSSSSVVSSDKAFFEKEMVQQAYFPSEHKLAVYLPLLGPLCTIVTLGFVKVMRRKKEADAEKKNI